MIAAEGAARGVVEDAPPAEPLIDRETIVRWSGVACLYVGTAAALACLWSPV
jgi:hypothetical protein